MKKLIARPAVLVLGVFVVACAPAPEAVEEEAPVAAMSPTETFVEFVKDWDAALNAADVDAVLALYQAEGSAVMPPDQPEVAGGEEMRAFFEAFFGAGDVTVTNVVESAIAEGDILAGKGSYTVEATTADGELATQTGSWLAVLARQADGSYTALRNIWNRDAPLSGEVEQPSVATSAPAPAADAACYESPMALDQGLQGFIRARDAAAYVAALSEDGSLIPPDMPEKAGQAEVAAFVASSMDQFSDMKVEHTGMGEAIQGSLGYTHGNYALDYTPVDGGEHLTGAGKYLAVSTRGDDGCWRLQWLLWNSDSPSA